jgi:CDP-diacylglycerol--serine O-phosphatidyltransferase
MATMSLLMVSRIPTLSVKHIHVPRAMRPALVGFMGLVFSFAIMWPWATMTAALVVYLATIPMSAVSARYLEDDGD